MSHTLKLADAIGDCDIIIDRNCTISEFADLLDEVVNHYRDDPAAALKAVLNGEVQFEEVHDPLIDCWAWHIKQRRN
jgi:hypothetical protein